MAKIELWVDSGANIHSCNKEVIDTVEDWGMEDGEWESLSEEEQYEQAMSWAWESAGLEVGVREVD